MSFAARLKSDVAYLKGALRTLKRTTPIGKNPGRTIREGLEEQAERWGDRPALISDRESYSYRQLNERANRYARWARANGIGKGEVVALVMSNRAEYLAFWLGVAKAGGVTALINTNLTGASLAHCISVVSAKAVVVDPAHAAALETARPHLPRDIALWGYGECGHQRLDTVIDSFDGANPAGDERPALTIEDRCIYIYTSGTTGLPKAANMNHYRVQLAMFGFSGVTGANENDRVYDCLPMYHTVGGVLGPGIALMNGGACVLREKFSAREFWADVKRNNCTIFCYIGELCRYLVNTPPGAHDRDHGVRMCFGNGLRPDVWPAFRDRFGIAEIREYYAATEGNCTIFNFDSRAGAVGRIPWFLKSKFPIKVVRFDVETEQPLRDSKGFCIECAPDEAGEMIGQIVNDPNKPAARFEGYADKAATDKKVLHDVFEKGDAWFRTGDLMRRDAAGYFFFVDRIGDTFRWKGENVSTNEVSERLTGFPGLVESTVYGVAVPGHDGRAGMISLVIEDPDRFDLAGFWSHVRAQLPDYARPLFLRVRQQLDMTGTFKQRKVDLVGEGFDPARVIDPLYFSDAQAQAYVPLDGALHERIVGGAMRL
ncbi:MAG: long-chain-acyl-CoA synthetase [Methylobacteriaceae bacterium]|nr:long-chain-acyl-CoA synthetase [Methylobacteriaceae bacterium]